MLKLARRARGHFVTLIEIRVHLIRVKPGHISVMQRESLMNRSRSFPTKYGTFPTTECIIPKNRRKSESCSIAALDMVGLL